MIDTMTHEMRLKLMKNFGTWQVTCYTSDNSSNQIITLQDVDIFKHVTSQHRLVEIKQVINNIYKHRNYSKGFRVKIGMI